MIDRELVKRDPRAGAGPPWSSSLMRRSPDCAIGVGMSGGARSWDTVTGEAKEPPPEARLRPREIRV